MNALVQAFKQNWFFIAVFGGIFVVATGLIMYTTNIAPWVFSDSTSYLWTARNIASGVGLVIQNPAGGYEPAIWFPPLYPFLLSVPLSIGADALQTARWVNAIAFGLLVDLGSYYIWFLSKSRLFTIGATLVFFCNPYLIKISSGVLSEPVFVLFTFISLFYLLLAINEPERMFLWAIASLTAGLSFLTRYVGISVVLTIIFFAVLVKGNFGKRIKRIMLVVVTSGVPLIAWVLYAINKSGSIGGRHLSIPSHWFTILQKYFQELWGVFLNWIPFVNRGNQFIPAFVKVLVIVLFIGTVFFYTAKKKNHTIATRGVVVLSIFMAMYVVFHLMTYLVVNEQPDADYRLFLPVYLGAILSFLSVFTMLERIRFPRFLLNGFFAGSILVFVIYFGKQTTEIMNSFHSEGYGYTSAFWQQSGLTAEIETLNSEELTYSNDAAFVLFYTGSFPKQLSLAECVKLDSISKKNEYLIVFRPQAESVYGEKAANSFIEMDRKFQVIYKDNAGTIYFVAQEK